MKIFRTIRDTDFGENIPEPEKYIKMRSVRVVVFDENKKIALINATKKNFFNIPGGSIEKGESIEKALRREIHEEIGCELIDIKEIGIIEEYRNALSVHRLSYCFTAQLLGEKGPSHLEGYEIKEGFETVWVDLEEAIKIFEAENFINHYKGKFIRLRDIVLLKEVQKIYT